MTKSHMFSALDLQRTEILMSALADRAAQLREESYVPADGDGHTSPYALTYEQAVAKACTQLIPGYVSMNPRDGCIEPFVAMLLRDRWNETLDNANVILSLHGIPCVSRTLKPSRQPQRDASKQIGGLDVCG